MAKTTEKPAKKPATPSNGRFQKGDPRTAEAGRKGGKTPKVSQRKDA